jgi:HD-GYP domain-containing protein (c-di-GMP phosphodiesterase class II)
LETVFIILSNAPDVGARPGFYAQGSPHPVGDTLSYVSNAPEGQITPQTHFETDFATKRQANKQVSHAQYPVKQVVTSFHDNAPLAALGGQAGFRYTTTLRVSRKPTAAGPAPSVMPQLGEIWYFERSPAAPLVHPLRRRYALRALPRPSRGRPTVLPSSSEALVVCLADLARDDLTSLRRLARREPRLRLIGISRNGGDGEDAAGCFATLPRKAASGLVRKTVAAAFDNIELAQRERATRAELRRTEREMEELNRIGIALSETRDVGALLDMILAKARHITGADAGSLYLVEEVRPDALAPGPGELLLRFKLTQNDSVQFPYTEFVLPMREDSLAGYSAMHGEVINLVDAYRIPRGRPYRFNEHYDEETGYKTRSLVTLPMKNGRGEVIGILQLINRKIHPAARLTSAESVAREVLPFSERDVRLALSLASQAAVAYENSRLYQDFEALFEGFVQAAITAIEQRDPTTSGHSQRVSEMTVGLAEAVDRVQTGNYAGTRFTPAQMKEIRYAALLHDFGKVGVREEVLVKAKKLYPMQMDVLAYRFDYLYKDIEARLEREKFQTLLKFERAEALSRIGALEEEYRLRRVELENAFQAIVKANEPTLLPSGHFDRLFEIARQTYRDPRGIEHPVLTAQEVRFLSIPKGSLDPGERSQIESHVVHSFNFLLQIPWTKEIREIPRIACAHHEKLNGTGYPYKLKSDEIPIQAKIMTICDMFDAISASDRPYKKAVPAERALDILDMSVKQHELDPELYRLFLEAKVFDRASKH